MFTTTTKKKTSRWQALMLAGLVLAGGAVAVPHAADAATSKSMTCTSDFYAVCKLRVTVSKTGASARTLDIRVTGFGNHTYRVVDLSRGKVVCSGTLSGVKWKRCIVSNRSAVLSIEVKKAWYDGFDVQAKLY